MKKICGIWILILLLTALMPAAVFAEPTPTETVPSAVTPAPTEAVALPSARPASAAAGSVVLDIDSTHKYTGMDKAYKNGYVPLVKNGRAVIVLPLIASGELMGDSITATPQLGDPKSSPFVFKNYQIKVKQKDNPVNDGKTNVLSYLVSFSLPLNKDRQNGVYKVVIDVKGRGMQDGGEITQSFTTYVTVADVIPPEEGKSSGPDVPVSMGDTAPERPSSQPKVIVSSYTLIPSPVIAGKEFTAKVTLKNTSESKAVQNMTVDITCESPNLTLLNESGTLFIGRMGRGATREIELRYRADTETPAQKYNIALAISYDDASATQITSAGVVEVAVQQAMNVKMEPPQIAREVNAGDTMPLSVQVMNLGRSMVYNARVELSVPGLLPSGTAFIGNMEAGTAMDGKMDVFVGTMDMSEGYGGNEKYGYTSGTLELVYEDAAGQEFRDSLDISTLINEPLINTSNTEEEEKPETASQWWVSVIIGIVVIGALCVFFLIRRGKQGADT